MLKTDFDFNSLFGDKIYQLEVIPDCQLSENYGKILLIEKIYSFVFLACFILFVLAKHRKKYFTKLINDSIFVLLDGMLQENPQKRWDFKKILKYYKEKEKDSEFSNYIPTEEAEYAQKFFIEFKEKTMEKTFENLEKLYKEHDNMYGAYINKVTRPKDAKFHLDRAWDTLHKMLGKVNEIGDKSINLNINKIACLINFGDWHAKVGNLKDGEDYFNKAKIKNEELKLELQKKDDVNLRNILFILLLLLFFLSIFS